MFYAYTIYASINKGITQQQLVHTRPYRRLGSSGSSGGRSNGIRMPQQPAVGPVQPLRHHLSLSLPVAGGGSGSSRIGMPRAERVDGSLLHTIRERFDKATMVQVCCYSGCSCPFLSQALQRCGRFIQCCTVVVVSWGTV